MNPNTHQAPSNTPIPQAIVNSKLTEVQKGIAVYVAKGFTNAEIAGYTGSTTTTINSQMTSIFTKLGVDSRAEVAVWAAKEGLV